MNPGEPLPVAHLLDGRYRIRKVLGQGGMGRVYLANDTRLANRPVAAKEMILGEGLQEQKAIADFNREEKVLASLSHPNIPQIIDFFAEGGRHYLVMEYVAGEDLQHRLDALGAGARLPEAQVVEWARQMLDVLHFLHGQKPPLIYRDLKPANIMIDHDGRAMLIDFGIARFLPPGGRGTQIGSVGYAPPEQYLGNLEPRSDLYALAATLHHLLTGRDPQLEPPFSFPALRQLAPEVSTATADVVMSALNKDLDQRPPSARAMADRLPRPETLGAPVAVKPGSGAGAAKGPSQMATIVLSSPLGSAASRQGQLPLSPSSPISPVSARAKTRAGLKVALPKIGLSQPAPGSAASTAKTHDLGLKRQSSAAPSKPVTIAPKPIVALPAKPILAPTPAPLRSSPIVASLVHKAVLVKTVVAKTVVAKTVVATPTVRSSAPVTVAEPGPVSGGAARNGVGNGAVHNGAQPTATPAAAWLIAPSEGLRFPLNGVRIVIGRHADGITTADLDLTPIRRGAERVSHRHAELIKQGPDYFIRDLGSLNGTYVGGRGRLGRDQLYKLRDRDEIVLGGAKLEFRKG